MALRVLRELPYLSIYHDYVNDWIYADWHGGLSPETAREGGEAVLALIAAVGCRKLLNDNSRVTDMWVETHEWRAMNVFPRLHEAGLQFVAWVYSANLYSRLSVDRSLDQLSQPLTLAFEEVTVAIGWLRTVNLPA
jgi:hypothetical protein